MDQLYITEDLDTSGIVRNKEFLIQGLTELNRSAGEHAISVETFVKTILWVADRPDRGFVRMFYSGNRKPLSFMVAYETVPPFKDPVLLIYAHYSNGKSKTVTDHALYRAELWARGKGYKKMIAYSYRNSGASIRYFDLKGFKPDATLFSRPL